MAVVISPYVGDARGKLGEGVFMRSKGQTIVRGYNPSPLNRRTVSQQVQRAQFSAAVKFFSRGVQNLFQFAFETKPTKESDYNAFMRLNAKKGMYFGPAENANEAFPCLAPWAMTRGSLRGDQVYFEQLPRVYFYGMSSVPVRTIGAFSTDLIAADSNYEAGDILTFVNIGSWIGAGSASYPFEHVPDTVPDWDIYQIILDPSDTTPMPSDVWFMEMEDERGLGVWPHQEQVLSTFCSACCFVHSRLRNGKVYVSNSDLCLNGVAEQAYNYGRSDTWRGIVMAAWGTEQESILQGSIARRSPSGQVVLTTYPVFPTSVADIDDASVFGTINAELNAASVQSRLTIKDNDGVAYTSVVSGFTIYFSSGSSFEEAFQIAVNAVNGQTILVFTGSDPNAVIQSVAWT